MVDLGSATLERTEASDGIFVTAANRVIEAVSKRVHLLLERFQGLLVSKRIPRIEEVFNEGFMFFYTESA